MSQPSSSHDTVLFAVGQRVRELRQSRSWTLERLAEMSGVSLGNLSEVERGIANPTFITLLKIAHALGVSASDLLPQSAPRTPVVRRAERRRLTLPHTPEDIVSELVTPGTPGSVLEVVWTEWPPGMSSEKQPFQHAGEECGLLLSGELEVGLGAEVHRLAPGDSISYPSTVPHWYRNPGGEPAVSVWAITPPTY